MNVIINDKKSAKNQRWTFASYNEKDANYYSAKYNIPFEVARILSGRNILPEEVDDFLVPKLKNLMPSPFILKDMDKAVDVTIKALKNNEIIGVFGDYDVDGGTSSAIMKRYFNMINVSSFVHIPDRMTEGYGPNIEAFRKLSAQGASLIITVDCGSAAPDVMAMAQNEGLKCIILDHHLTDGATDGAEATVNPNRMDDVSDLGDMTAAGVSFLFCVALTKSLRENDYFKDRNIIEPNLLSLLDLAALGTICDVAPITGLNRAIVSSGLRVMQHGSNIGISELAKVGKITETFNSYHCGFVLGPRINAGGRVGRASAGFELLTTECPITAAQLADELDSYNHQRKAIENNIQDEATTQIEEMKLFDDPVIIAYGMDWHPGIVGIVASRIKEKYGKPTFILGSDGVYLKGSGRSIHGVDIGNAIREAHREEIIIAGGGHKMAAGLSITEEQVPHLRRFFKNILSQDVLKAQEDISTIIDSEVTVTGANYCLYEAMEKLAPFGVGNSSPVLGLRNIKVNFFKLIGENHIKLRLTDHTGAFLNAVCFRCMDIELGKILAQKDHLIDIIGSLKKDTYHNGENVQFIIDDASIAGIF